MSRRPLWTLRRAVPDGVELAWRDTGVVPADGDLGWDNPWAAAPEATAAPGAWDEVPVMLLHGLAGDGRSWTDFARRLAAVGRRAIVPDLRGHGQSGRSADYTFEAFRDDVLALAGELALERVDVVGHALGGHVATMVAQARPKLVRRLVVEESPPPPRDEAEAMPFADRNRRPRARMGPKEVLSTLPTLLRFDQRALGHVAPAYRTPSPDWWAALPAITAETLLLYGGPSGPVPLNRLDAQAEAIPDCRIATFAEAGHRIHSGSPEQFAEVVLPFLTA
ncbi:alpha/beta hydrolase [Phytomonospora sp. NPDC050363]|uniref:alpha/beta fold hydrolase n=1 Tax=Phytomonospora sp. NPDC050363 TaxID=3155642 RepID=UPI0033CCFC4A